MKTKNLIYAALLFLFSAGLLGAQESNKIQPDNDKVADMLVNKILKVKPYEVVIIQGAKDQIELMSSIYVMVYKAGGYPTVELDLPEAKKKALMETPDEYLKAINSYRIFKNRMVDCFIGIGSNNNPTLFADVPESKIVAASDGNFLYNKLADHYRYRAIGLGQASGIPTKAFAKSVNANYEEMMAGFWKSINTDYDKLTKRGKLYSEFLKPGSVCKITSKYGTDINFKIDNFPARISCGNISENRVNSGPINVWLPAGEVFSCVLPGSANGKIVVPSYNFRGVKIKNLEISVKNGRIAGIKADENEKILSEMVVQTKKDIDVISAIDIGMNEDSKPYSGSDFYTYEMAGILSINFGNNIWAGGNNDCPNAFILFLDSSSLTIDGKEVVKDGKLMLD